MDPKHALRRARIWKNVNIVFMIVPVVICILTKDHLPMAFGLLFRGCLLFVVYKFINELENAQDLNEVV